MEVNMVRGVYRRIYGHFTDGKRINRLTLEAEAWFWRCHSIADDFGNFEGNDALLHLKTVGRRTGVSSVKVGEMVKQMTECKLISEYNSREDRYFHIHGFISMQPAGRNGRRIRKCPESPFDDEVLGESGGIRVQPANPDMTSLGMGMGIKNGRGMQGGNQTGAQALHGAGMDGISIPDGLKGDIAFVGCWNDWSRYMDGRVDEWSPMSQRMQLQRCAEWGAFHAVNVIRHSIEHNYASLIEPKINGHHKKPAQRPLKPGEIEHYG